MRHMQPRLSRLFAAAAVACVCSLVTAPAAAQGVAAATQSSAAAGVTVKVTPRQTGAEAAVWVIAVVLDTHSAELSDDPVRTTVLVTDDGREIRPASWTGAGPGGHHREGSLEFPAPRPLPQSFELRMQRPGESQVRTFRFGP